jgi:hypothetical protein
MDLETVGHLLLNELGAKLEGETWTLDDSARLTIMVMAGERVQSIERVKSIRIADRFLALTNADGTYYLDQNAIHGFRDERVNVANEARPGFH